MKEQYQEGKCVGSHTSEGHFLLVLGPVLAMSWCGSESEMKGAGAAASSVAQEGKVQWLSWKHTLQNQDPRGNGFVDKAQDIPSL